MGRTVRLSRFWRRLCRCWALLCNARAFDHFDSWQRRITALERLLGSPAAIYTRRAVEKNAADRSFHPTKDHVLKRSEAEQWARAYARDDGAELHAWETAFLIEWMVGERRGFL